MDKEEVVIGLQGVLSDALWGDGTVRRQPEAFLQFGQRQPIPLLGRLQPGDHPLVGVQPAAHIQGLDHQSSCRITVSAGDQLLPERPPAPVWKQFALVAAMEQRPGLAAQRLDQVIQVDAPGPPVTLVPTVEPHQLAGELTAQQHLQPVMEDPHCHLVADQRRRHGVDDSPDLDRAGAPDLELLDVVVGKAMRR